MMVKFSRMAVLLAAATLAMAGCSRVDGAAAVKSAPLEVGPGTTCALDGMLLADYPGPKAQVRYEGAAEPEFFCDTVELFSALLKPEQVRPVKGAFVQDMAQTEWERPRGAWIPARDGWYVIGSRKQGSMGPTIASFAQEADARKFSGEHGGKVLPYAEIKADMVDLSGGAQHDQKM
jgi:copper chaperone NosL